MDKLFYKQWLSGAMLIIPTVMAEQLSGIHFGNPSWAVKSGAPQGRNVHDISYCETPEHILNGSRSVGELSCRPSARDAGVRLCYRIYMLSCG